MTTSGDALFGRRAKLTVGDLELESEGSEGLRVAFTVRRDLKVAVNKATIRVHNLNADTRARIEGAQPRLILQAGYKDTIGTIFTGDKAFITSTYEAPDWVTTIDSGDGLSSCEQKINTTLKKDASLRDGLKEIKRIAVGVAGAIRGGASLEEILDKVKFKGGKVLKGRVCDVLEDMAKQAGLEASIQDNELVMLGPKEVREGYGIELAPGSGLLGTPARVLDPKRKKLLILKGDALMMPDLVPGRRLVLSSRNHSGEFKVTKVTFTGDTHGLGRSWVTRWEAIGL